MASVPNLPIAPAVPTPGAPGASDADGSAVDLFAQLLGGGPLMAVVAGPGATPAGEVTLRAAPADGDTESADGETAPDGSTPADIIPLLQAQSGFPVSVAPAARLTGPVPTEVTPAPAPRFAPIPNVGQPAVPAAADAQQAIKPEGDAEPAADIVGVAVKAAVDKIAGKPAARADKSGRAALAASPEGKHVEAAVASAQSRPAETVARIEAAVQPIASGSLTISTVPTAPQSATPVAAPA